MEAFEKVYGEVRAQLKKAREDNEFEEAADYEKTLSTLEDFKTSFIQKYHRNIAKLIRNENCSSTPTNIPIYQHLLFFLIMNLRKSYLFLV